MTGNGRNPLKPVFIDSRKGALYHVRAAPAFRRRGIGLKMVCDVTALLRDAGCDYSYIHYTGVAPWYARLGYRTCLRWSCAGPLPEGESGPKA